MRKAKEYLWRIALLLLCVTPWAGGELMAQQVGTWELFPSYHNATYCRVADGKVFVVANGNLYSYNTEDSEIETYSRLTGLSGVGIERIEYNDNAKKLLVLYSDANIDIVDVRSGNVVNMPQLKEKTLSDKTVNDVLMEDTRAYLSCNFGIVVIDMEDEAFVSIYNPGGKVVTCAIYEGRVYAQTTFTEKKAIVWGDETANLQDPSQWTAIGWGFLKMRVLGDRLYAMNNGLVYSFHLPQMNDRKQLLTASWLTDVQVIHYPTGDKLLFRDTKALYEIANADDTPVKYSLPDDFQSIDYSSGNYYMALGEQGLCTYKLQDNAWVQTAGDITPNSPVRDYFGYMTFVKNRLLVAGGSHNYTGNYYKGTVMYLEDNTWTNFQEDTTYLAEGITAGSSQAYVNITSVAQDPYDQQHHFASSFGHGIYEFRNGKLLNHYDCTNSPLSSIRPESTNYKHYVRVNGLTYDDDGNLWMFNNEVDTIIRILKHNGTWAAQYYSPIEGNTKFDFYKMRDNTIWINSERVTESAGLARIRYSSTPASNRAGSMVFKHTTCTNQDGVNYTVDYYYCMEFDKDGQLWIGTNLGPFVLTDPDEFTENSTYTQIKINRNDGSGLADYLLSGVSITAIAVDGANRKWLGTDGQGIYLVSADGQETIQHFTTENSPMPSDYITSIAINEESGAVMIGSMSGLSCYYSDAVEPEVSLEKYNVYAYPNPVRPEYSGDIYVRGLSTDCTVKICTTSGQLVAQGTSTGGLFTWDGRDQSGRRVAAGIYNVFISDNDAYKGITCRIVIIR